MIIPLVSGRGDDRCSSLDLVCPSAISAILLKLNRAPVPRDPGPPHYDWLHEQSGPGPRVGRVRLGYKRS